VCDKIAGVGMMRKLFYILIGVCAAMQTHAAGWDTSATWPSWSYPRNVTGQVTQIYLALEERNRAVGTDWEQSLSAPAWWRTARTELTIYKSVLNNMMIHFSDTNTFTNNVFGSNYTASNIFKYAKLPTNYLSYTPYRCLSGLGPFTNDTSVGRPYGWTNAYTVAGGTNFPAGRTNWYTTDYGFTGITNIINLLRATAAPNVVWKETSSNHVATGSTYKYLNATSYVSYAEANSTLESLWNDSSGWTDTSSLNRYRDDIYVGSRVYSGYWDLGSPPYYWYTFMGQDPISYSFYIALTPQYGWKAATNRAVTVDFFARWYAYPTQTNYFGLAADAFRLAPNPGDKLLESGITGAAGTTNFLGGVEYFKTCDLPDTQIANGQYFFMDHSTALLTWDFNFK
jgi:hypothetical protein